LVEVMITKDEESASFATYEAIAATLQCYIDGARAGDSLLIRRAFLEAAHIRGTYGGKLVDWTLPEFCDVIGKGGRATDLSARIVQVDYAGMAASARLEADNWRGTRYTDFFVLIKNHGDWLIASKVFYAHSRS
jgi:hypothetical protein